MIHHCHCYYDRNRGYDFCVLADAIRRQSIIPLNHPSLFVCTGVFINEIQEKIRQKLTLEKKTIKKPTKFEWDPVIVVLASSLLILTFSMENTNTKCLF